MSKTMRSAELLVLKAQSDQTILQDLQQNPQATLQRLANEAIQALPSTVPAPDQKVANFIWIVIVVAFAIVMVGAAWTLAEGVTTKLDGNGEYVAKSDVLLTIFTAAVAFLAGLLSPSPIKN